MLIVDLLLESNFTQDWDNRAIRFHDLGVKFGMKLQKHFSLKVKLLLKKSSERTIAIISSWGYVDLHTLMKDLNLLHLIPILLDITVEK